MPVDADPQSGFCRDCQAVQRVAASRCAQCGSPRLLVHPELYELSMAHLDCDAFYAAVEKRDNPELRNKAVIIGGGKRGVVSTACYIARISGVRSAMPMYQALKLCPHAIVIKPDMAKYVSVGKVLRERMQSLSPLVEPISIDEAFVDLSGTQLLHREPPALTLSRFVSRVESEIGITVSVGLSYCKFLAKVASDFQKPRGFSIIGQAEAVSFLADKPVTLIWGVGAAFNSRLQRDGIRTIGQLQTMEEASLIGRYGSMGRRLYRLSRGMDERTVHASSEAKSVSSETTFNEDLSTYDELVPVLRRLSESVSRRLKSSELAGQTVVLKLKTSNFKTRTRNMKLSDPTRLADRIFRVSRQLLQKEIDGTRFRLIGVGVSELCEPRQADPPDLVDPQSTKRASVEGAVDILRRKFGNNAVETGYTFRSAPKK